MKLLLCESRKVVVWCESRMVAVAASKQRFVVTSVLSLRQMRALLVVDPTSEMTAANVQ